MRIFKIIVILLIGILAACRDQQSTAGPYAIGSTYNEIADQIGESFADVPRPQAGWEPAKDQAERTHRHSEVFESSTGKTVMRTRVYYVPRTSSGLRMNWDYVFFDANDLVLGAHREFID